MEKISEEISSTLTFIIDKICSSTEVTKNIKSSNNTLRFKVASETQCCLAPINRENKQNLEESSTQNCSLPTSVATSVQFNSAAKNSCLQISSSSTSSTSSSKNNQKIKLQKMEQQPKPVPRILPKKSFVTTKQPPKLFVLQQSSSSSINENEKNVQQQQIFRGISSTLISTTNHPPSIKINTSKLVSTSTSSSSSLSSLNNTITTSTLSMSFKNVCNTTSCGSSSPKIVFTLKPSPSTSVGNINDDNNKGIKSTSFTPNSIAPSSSKQQPPLCKTPPKNKKISVKRPAQLNTTTNKNFSSSSPLLDSNDSLTNTVNKVAAGADISPTNLDQNTTTNTQTNIINKSKQIKKKTCTKPRILCDEQKVKGGNASICNNKNTKIQPVVPCISPKIVGASPPQTQSTLIPLESAASSSSSEIATTTNTIYNSNLQTLPSSGMLLPGSQFALNGNLVSGMHYFIRQPTSAVGNSVQQQQQQFVPLMSSQPIFFSPVDGGVQQQQQQDVQQTQQVTSPTKFSPTNLMTTRNVFLHTGNGLFIPTTMFSQQNFVGIQNPRPFLPTTTTTLTSISSSLQSSGSSKFVLQLAKSSNNNNNLTSTIMPNILPKNSGKGKTIISTSIASNNVTVNENTILSSPPCQKNQQQQNQFLPFLQEGGGGNIYINNQQYLQQLLNIQQQNNNNDNMKGNLFLQNIDGDVINKKIEGGGKVIQQQQKKQTRTRKKKGENNNVVVVDSNSTNVLLNNNKIPPKFNDMTTTSILQQQQPEQFDEEENEPPPVLCRGEISSELSNNGTKSIENVFQKEAKIIREKMFDANGKKYGPIVHDIDGFCIEEDVEPFPCENQEILEKLIRVDNAINNQQRGEGGEEVEINNGNEVNSSEENINSSSSSTNKNSSAELNISNNTIKKRHRKNSSSSSEEGAAVIEEERSLSFSKSPPIRKYKRMSTSKIDEKQQQQPTNKRRRELENLLKMDFGPGKTPFQTSDPDEYAEEVLGGRKRTLALAAEEKIARKSMERPGSSSKKRDKDKSLTSIISSFNSNEKQQEKEPRRSDESIEEGCCSYCRKPFSEVGRDKEHEQYCSKECRRNKKYAKKLLQKQKILEENNKGIVNEKIISSQECSNNSSLIIVSSSSINSTTTISSPIKSTTPNNNTTTIKSTTKTNIITSPLGSAFSTLQPQMLATNKNNILLNNSTTKTLNEQTAQILVQKQLGEQIASIAQGFEIQSSSSSSSLCNEQQQKPIIPRPYGAPFNLIPHVSHPKQIITTLPLQQQPQHLFAAHFHPHAAGVYLSGQDSTNTNFASFLTHSQSPPNQQPQLIMPTPFVTSSSSQQQHLRQQFLQSPINTPTPPITTTNNNNNEKNVEIESLITKSIFTWTSEEVSKWVNFITNSESNGERFIQQEIDGSSLVLLTCEQLQNELKLKLGPAVKLNNALNALKARQPYI